MNGIKYFTLRLFCFFPKILKLWSFLFVLCEFIFIIYIFNIIYPFNSPGKDSPTHSAGTRRGGAGPPTVISCCWVSRLWHSSQGWRLKASRSLLSLTDSGSSPTMKKTLRAEQKCVMRATAWWDCPAMSRRPPDRRAAGQRVRAAWILTVLNLISAQTGGGSPLVLKPQVLCQKSANSPQI